MPKDVYAQVDKSATAKNTTGKNSNFANATAPTDVYAEVDKTKKTQMIKPKRKTSSKDTSKSGVNRHSVGSGNGAQELYAEVDKSKKSMTLQPSAPPLQELYAEVDKSQKKPKITSRNINAKTPEKEGEFSTIVDNQASNFDSANPEVYAEVVKDKKIAKVAPTVKPMLPPNINTKNGRENFSDTAQNLSKEEPVYTNDQTNERKSAPNFEPKPKPVLPTTHRSTNQGETNNANDIYSLATSINHNENEDELNQVSQNSEDIYANTESDAKIDSTRIQNYEKANEDATTPSKKQTRKGYENVSSGLTAEADDLKGTSFH